MLSLYNAAAMFEAKAAPASAYRRFFLDDGAGADQCSACGECETKCPQGIPIVEKLREAHAHLTSA